MLSKIPKRNTYKIYVLKLKILEIENKQGSLKSNQAKDKKAENSADQDPTGQTMESDCESTRILV